MIFRKQRGKEKNGKNWEEREMLRNKTMKKKNKWQLAALVLHSPIQASAVRDGLGCVGRSRAVAGMVTASFQSGGSSETRRTQDELAAASGDGVARPRLVTPAGETNGGGEATPVGGGVFGWAASRT